MKIKINEIIVPPNRREVDAEKVRQLAESIREIGLLNPISVTKEKRLVAGAHRLEAVKLNGETEIEITIVDCDEFHLELAEIDENLIRNELDPISMGELPIRRDEILEPFGQRAHVGQGRPAKNGAESAPLKTTTVIAKEIGISQRVLQENKQLARNLDPQAKEVVRATAIAFMLGKSRMNWRSDSFATARSPAIRSLIPFVVREYF